MSFESILKIKIQYHCVLHEDMLARATQIVNRVKSQMRDLVIFDGWVQ